MIKLYSPRGDVIWSSDTAELNDLKWEGTCHRSVMSCPSLQLTINSETPLEIPIGSYIDYEGYRYTLYYPENLIKHHSKSIEYQLLLHGEEELLKSYKLKDVAGGKPYRLKFFLTSKPIDFLRVIVDTLNLSDSGWQMGDCIDAGEKTIAFNHEDCLSALNRVAKEFDTEWEIKGKTISLGKVSYFKDDPLPLQYGMGKGFRSGVARRNDGDRMPIGRLYVEGGSRNIDRKYGSPTLLLPKSATIAYDGQTYRTDPDGMYVEVVSQESEVKSIAEGSYDGSDVYPMREGRVSEVIEVKEGEATFYDIKDSSIPEELDYSQYRIAGEKATIVFQSGALAGREFDLEQSESQFTGYIHTERRFKIVPAEIDGYEMPGGTFVPAEGDKYAIFHISLPNQYLTSASQRMLEDSVKYLSEQIHPTFIFDGEVDPIHTRDKWLEIGGRFVPGGHILFSDPQFHPEGSVIRITAIKTPLTRPWNPELTLSNAPIAGEFSSDLGKLEAEPVLAEERDRQTRRLARRGWQEVKETQEMLFESMDKLGKEFSEGISPVTLQTMQIAVGSEMLQYRFVRALGSTLVADHKVTWNSVGASLDVDAGVIQHLTLGLDTMSAKIPASEYRYWSLPRYISPALSDKLVPYYLYARVEGEGDRGTFELDTKPRAFDEVADYYNLLVGMLSSERNGSRSFAPMYGGGEWTPNGLAVKLIRSLDGKTYFDLEKGEIGGKINFRGGTLDEWADYQEEAMHDEKAAREAADREAKEMIDAIEVGGRNLLLKSGTVVKNSGYRIATYHLSDEGKSLKNNEEVTLVIKGKLGEGKKAFAPYNSGGIVAVPSLRIGANDFNADGIACVTGRWVVNNDYPYQNSQLFVYVFDQKTVVESEIEWIKLVRGNKTSREWKAAPEDVAAEMQSKIRASEDASKAAWEAYANTKAEAERVKAEAYADGKVDEEEQARIAAAQKAYDDAVAKAKELTDAIDIGGRNLLRGTSDQWVERTVRKYGAVLKMYVIHDDWRARPLIHSLEVKDIPDGQKVGLRVDLSRSDGSYTSLYPQFYISSAGKITYRYTINDTQGEFVKLNVRVFPQKYTSDIVINTRCEQLEVGNKATDWTPAPEDVAARISLLRSELSNAQTTITALQTLTQKLKTGKINKADVLGIEYLLDAFNHGTTTVAGGLIMSQVIAISNKINEITSYLSGYSDGGGIAFGAGVSNFGTNSERQKVAIYHDGTARFGQMHFNESDDGEISIIDESETTPHKFLQWGGTAPTESEMTNANTIIREFALQAREVSDRNSTVEIESWESIESNREIRFVLNVTAKAISVSEPIDQGGVGDDEVFYPVVNSSCSAYILAEVFNTSGGMVWSGQSTTAVANARTLGGRYNLDDMIPPDVVRVSKTITLPVDLKIPANVMVKGYVWNLKLVVSGYGYNWTGSSSNGKSYVPYDNSKPFVAMVKDKVAFFFGRQKQVLFNYMSDWLVKVVGNVLIQGNLKIDGYLDGAGMPLAGATLNKEGALNGASFGKYKNKSSQATPSAAYYQNKYIVYHTIPNGNYLPIVNPWGSAGLTAVIKNVRPYYFEVIIGDGVKSGFSYVCYEGS